VKPLGELVDPTRGITYGIVQPGEHDREGIPIIRVTDLKGDRVDTRNPMRVKHEIEGSHSRTRLRGGELIMSIVGTVGQTAIIDSSLVGWNVARAIAVIPVREEIGADWVRLCLRGGAALEHIGSRLNTTVQATLNLRDLSNLPIKLPPIAIRNAITSVICALNDKIELNRRTNGNLEAAARALFKDWFIDFGPTRAKIDGGAPYLAADIWAQFPDSLDGAGKPEGWVASTLGSHAKNFDAKRVPLSSSERGKRPGLYPYHGATGVVDHVDDFLFDGIYLLVGEDGSVVKENGLAFTQYVWGKFWVNNHAHVLQGNAPVSTEQLAMYFQHEMVTPYITGAVQLKLSQGRMNSMPFLFPGASLCERFHEVVAPLFERIRLNSQESADLARTRDLLLPKLMSGEIRVSEAQEGFK
jgi:type I restriction enzyme S subunit